jgi:protein involved in polysaccharide export with SLBB domain
MGNMLKENSNRGKDRASAWGTSSYLLCLAAVLICAGAPSAVSQDKAASARAIVGKPEANDKLTSIDFLAAASRLTIRVSSYPELTGDYRIGPDQTISVPAIGRLSIANMDGAALEKELTARTSKIAGRSAFATVEIAAYRPVFITGAVKIQGSVEWQPDMTVLQTIALAGGVVSQADSLMKPQELFKSIDGQKRDLASLARLKASRDGAPEVKASPELVGLVGSTEAGKLVTHEASILATEREAHAQKMKVLRQGIESEKEQIAALRKQMVSLNTQLDLRQTQLQKIRGLTSRGILTNERTLEQEIKTTDVQEKIVNIEVGIAKSVGTMANLQLLEVTLERDRQRLILEEIARLERLSTHTGIDIENPRGLLQDMTQKLDTARSNDDAWLYQITRRQSGGETMMADRNTQVRPGDVLIVARR